MDSEELRGKISQVRLELPDFAEHAALVILTVDGKITWSSP